MKYHQATWDLLEKGTPHILPDADVRIGACEAALGIKLPASLREFFSVEGALEVLHTLHGDDEPFGLDALRLAGSYDENVGWMEKKASGAVASERRYSILPRTPADETTRHHYDSEPLLEIMAERRGACRWALPLGGDDDPEVLVEDIDSDVWRRAAGRYSSFLYAAAWDRVLDARHGKTSGPLPSADVLDDLRARYHEGPSTFGWPGDWQLRFSDGALRIRINKLIDCDWADWYVDAGSRGALEAFARRAGLPVNLEEWEFPGARPE